MSKTLRCSRVSLILTLGALLCALPAAADTVWKGIDLLASQTGTYVDFRDNPLPQNFFGCGEQFAGTISLAGVPIASSPSVKPADTIIDRLDDVPLGTSGSTRIQIAALCLKKNSWTDPCGTSWTVKVRLDPNRTQPIGNMNIFHTAPSGGTFDSSMTVYGEVSWTSGNVTLGPVTDDISLSSRGGCWSHVPGSGGITVSGPVTIDRDCDGALDTTLPNGTSNFHPGWCPPSGGSGSPTWSLLPEDGPHPVGPPEDPCVGVDPVDPVEPSAQAADVEPDPCKRPVSDVEN